MKDVNAHIANTDVSSHTCANMKIDGCIVQAESSMIDMKSSSFTSVLMQDRSISFVFLSSTVAIAKNLFRELSGERSPCIIKAIKLNSLSISESTFVNFARQAVQIEETILTFSMNKVLLEEEFKKSFILLNEGFLVCKDCRNSLVKDSSFEGIKSARGSSLRIFSSKITKDNNLFIVSNNIFKNNNAEEEGGAIHLINENIQLERNEFSKNQARSGGAVYLNCSTEEDLCDWSVDSCTFTGNQARESGGALFWSNSYPKGKSNSFSNNGAAHGPNQASKPMKIVLINEKVDEFVSGQILENFLDFNIVDAYNQICSTLSMGQAFIDFDRNHKSEEEKPNYLQTIQGNEFFKIENGKFRVEKLRIISKPGREANLIFSTNTIDSFSRYVLIIINLY